MNLEELQDFADDINAEAIREGIPASKVLRRRKVASGYSSYNSWTLGKPTVIIGLNRLARVHIVNP